MIIFLRILATAAVAAAVAVSTVAAAAPSNAGSAEDTYHVSLVELITNPQKWEGKTVSVFGYLDGYNPTLFLTRDHAVGLDSESGVRVRKAPTGGYGNCMGAYVWIRSKFSRPTRTDAPGLFETLSVARWLPAESKYEECL